MKSILWLKFQNNDDDRNKEKAVEEYAFIKIEPNKHQEGEEEERDPLATNPPIDIAVAGPSTALRPIDGIKCERVNIFSHVVFLVFSSFFSKHIKFRRRTMNIQPMIAMIKLANQLKPNRTK